jgi:hypothetical protein
MGMLCAVSFNRYGRLYYLDPGEFAPQVGDRVLVPTDDGPEVAECVWAAQWVDEETAAFPKVAGLADDNDLRRDELLRKRKAEAKVAAKKLIKAHELPMKVVAVDHVLDQAGSGGARTTSAPPCTAGSSCASSPPATPPGSRAASARAAATCAAPPSSPTSSRSPSGWRRTRTCRSTRCASPAPAGG